MGPLPSWHSETPPPNAVEGQRSGLAPVEVLRVTVRGLVRAVGRDQRGGGMPDLVCVKIILAKGWVVSRDVQR